MNAGATLGRQELAEKFIEIKKPVEEVREIENKEQKLDENKGSKIIEKLEETILPTAHASDGDDKDYDANIEHRDTVKEARQHDKDEKEKIIQDAIANCDIL